MKIPPLWMLLLPLLIPIQLGVTYYISTFVAAFLLLLFVGRIPHLPPITFKLIILSSLMFLTKTASNMLGGGDVREYLLPMRELACFLALIVGSLKIRDSIRDPDNLQRLAVIMLSIITAMAILQLYNLSRGNYFGFPVSWFVKNQETLLGVDNALYHQSRFRPTAFYGEPSYAAFIVLSLMAIALTCGASSRLRFIGLLLSLASIFVLQSVAGLLSIFIFSFIWLIRSSEIGSYKYRFAGLFGLFIIGFFLVSFDNYLLERLTGISSGIDSSFANRVLDPFAILRDLLVSGNIFGITTPEISAFYGGDPGGALITNGLLWLFIYYGALVIPIALTLFRHIGLGLGFVYVVLCMNFNGDFFSFDKVVVVSLVLGAIMRSSRIRSKLCFHPRLRAATA